jgi:hypothetical protein
MPSKNKPKRLDRQKNWRVARRKKRQNALVKGNSRNRKPRPKHKGKASTKDVVEKKLVTSKKPVQKKVVKKSVKKVSKK